MIDAISVLFDVVSVEEQTPVIMRGSPCDNLYIVNTGSIDRLCEVTKVSMLLCFSRNYARSHLYVYMHDARIR